MSLINQMLRDLEARHADGREKLSLPNEVRPLPALADQNQWLTWAMIAGAAALLLALTWWVLGLSASVANDSEQTQTVLPETAISHDSTLRLDPDLTRARVQVPESGRPASTPRLAPIAEARSTGNTEGSVETNQSRPQIEKLPPGSSSNSTPLQRAREQLAAGRSDAAEVTLRQGLTDNPENIALRQTLFGLLVDQRRNDDALATLQEGLTLHSGQTQWAINAARLQVDGNDLPGAWETLQRSLPNAVNQADYRAFCGTVLSRLKRHGEAVDHYRAALASNPGEGRWWIGLALALEADGRLPESREAFVRAQASGSLSAELSAYVDGKLK